MRRPVAAGGPARPVGAPLPRGPAWR